VRPEARDAVLKGLIDALGREAALRLVDACGGEAHRVPKKPKRWVIDALGRADALRFCQAYGDTWITIPKAERWKRAERNRQIHADYDQSKLTVHQLVRKYRLTEKQIRTILDNPVEACDDYGFGVEVAHYPNGDSRTLDLFAAAAA
jgi:hypothetical protein